MTVLADADYPFALCLTHDVDRPRKTPVHAAYYALADRDPGHLRDLLSGRNPYWQFETVRALEDDLGVRSAFYFLSERPLSERTPRELLEFDALVQALGSYDVREPPLADAVRRLDEDGWEVGLHGSLGTATDRERLRAEKARIEDVLDRSVRGGRQHYLDYSVPETWRHYRALGLDYDASLGLSESAGFNFGYDVQRPFDDGFAVFPLTLMEQHLPDPADDFAAAWAVCEDLLETAAAEGAVATALFHPRYFSERDFPGYRRLYRRLVERALDRGAWVGPPGDFYDEFLADGERAAPGDERGDGVADADDAADGPDRHPA